MAPEIDSYTGAARAVGDVLRQARMERGLTVEDMARRTRLRASLITEIEAGHGADAFPSSYLRGHVRSLAQILGIDVDPLVDELAEFDTDPPP